MEIVSLVLLLLLPPPLPPPPPSQLPAAECLTSCGDVNIPYPFGIGPNCSFGNFYTLACTKNAHGHDRLFLGSDGSESVEIIDILLSQGKMRVYNLISWNCYNQSSPEWYFKMNGWPYRFSDADNKFTVIGCDTFAYINGTQGGKPYRSGCMTFCQNDSLSAGGSGSCAGLGCCQTSVPRGLDYIAVWFDSEHNGSSTRSFSPCSYAVLVEENNFSFQSSYITTTDFLVESYHGRVPVVLSWAIGYTTCEEARLDYSSYACVSEHSKCVDSSAAPGYLCNCSIGFEGNPYVRNGCQDINECQIHPNPCKGNCYNTLGGYNCSCPQGTTGNASSTGCFRLPTPILIPIPPIRRLPLVIKIVIGVCVGVIFLLSCGLCFYVIYQRRKLEKIKRRYFEEHGGLDLKKKMKEEQNLTFRIFAIKELEKATNNFDDKQILGEGGNGIVYKGVLEDKCIVAIKKPKLIDESLKRCFGNETLILSRINHDNIVKLLGCCLEIEMPMLVYEFVPNGTLSHLIHKIKNQSRVSLDTRLRIAYQSATALEYLHMEASPSILLDNDYNAKVSDFGASKLIPKDEQQFATLVQFTHGYIDPECLQTYELTYKSDVYSFGVVLLELFTGKKAISFEGPEEQRNLVTTFALFMNENRVFDIFDNQVKEESNMEFIQELSELIKRCLYLKGEDRPEMKEVVEELHTLRRFMQHPWSSEHEQDNVEREGLLEEITTQTDGTRELSVFYSCDASETLHTEGN
ncbi:wall-associated receptor kinase 2-like isoform X1 [Zingiber officinale]|uniref:wall-associated receptor kinase 2-like isoform X1 n=1 Tax=Zingiber officinale TaxID=94328 RepID=UPI001C4AC992|nr:wall-associated receptor kinase 2-like isoform X1 [Zingiber officinale]